jgi:alkyl hydroperoxide reductase subunit AhpC
MSLALKVGDQAPQFKDNSTQGVIDLADVIGKKNVVLALYFAIFTPV